MYLHTCRLFRNAAFGNSWLIVVTKYVMLVSISQYKYMWADGTFCVIDHYNTARSKKCNFN